MGFHRYFCQSKFLKCNFYSLIRIFENIFLRPYTITALLSNDTSHFPLFFPGERNHRRPEMLFNTYFDLCVFTKRSFQWFITIPWNNFPRPSTNMKLLSNDTSHFSLFFPGKRNLKCCLIGILTYVYLLNDLFICS